MLVPIKIQLKKGGKNGHLLILPVDLCLSCKWVYWQDQQVPNERKSARKSTQRHGEGGEMIISGKGPSKMGPISYTIVRAQGAQKVECL